MGGGQSLNFGLANLDTFAWVGGFSSAPNTKPPGDLIRDPAKAAQKLRLLYVSCGDKEGLLRISEGVQQMLDEKKVPHLYNLSLAENTTSKCGRAIYTTSPNCSSANRSQGIKRMNRGLERRHYFCRAAGAISLPVAPQWRDIVGNGSAAWSAAKRMNSPTVISP
jgi:hypothetical protein